MVYRAYLSGWEDESSQIVAVKTLKGMCGIGVGERGEGGDQNVREGLYTRKCCETVQCLLRWHLPYYVIPNT